MRKCKEHDFKEIEFNPRDNNEELGIRVSGYIYHPRKCKVCGKEEIEFEQEKKRKEEIIRIRKYGLKEERIRKIKQLIADYGLSEVDLFPYSD